MLLYIIIYQSSLTFHIKHYYPKVFTLSEILSIEKGINGKKNLYKDFILIYYKFSKL